LRKTIAKQPAPVLGAIVSSALVLLLALYSLAVMPPAPLPETDSHPSLQPTTMVEDARRLSSYYDFIGYDLSAIRLGAATVPRVVARTLPKDFKQIDSAAHRKTLFIKTLLPLVLQVNERIISDRRRVIALRKLVESGRKLPTKARFWLADRERRYRVEKGDFETLLDRMDVIPPSIALAQSAEETGWGTSRFARHGQALFGQEAYRDHVAQMAPRNGADYKIRVFDDLMTSVVTYIYNLNIHPAYREFRLARAAMRSEDGALDAHELAGHLSRYSERGQDYIDTILAIIRQNDLDELDSAALQPDPAIRHFVLPG